MADQSGADAVFLEAFLKATTPGEMFAACRPWLEAQPPGAPIAVPREALIAMLESLQLSERVLTAGEEKLERLLRSSETSIEQGKQALRVAEDAVRRYESLRRLLARAAPFVVDGYHGRSAAETSDVRCSIDAVLAAPEQVRHG